MDNATNWCAADKPPYCVLLMPQGASSELATDSFALYSEAVNGQVFLYTYAVTWYPCAAIFQHLVIRQELSPTSSTLTLYASPAPLLYTRHLETS